MTDDEKVTCLWCHHTRLQHFYVGEGCDQPMCNCPGYTEVAR